MEHTENTGTYSAVLVGLQIRQSDDAFARAMDELEMLAQTAGITTELRIVQRADSPVRATYVGSGKLQEIKTAVNALEADLVIFDQELAPMQFRNLHRELGTEVMDRTGLILRIFSDQARTREARLQVELANLQYILPRLAGMWTHFGRQAGASGAMSNRGAGETQIELDRRHIEHRMAELNRELAAVEKERATQRERRLHSALPRVALVGYTNAGKSTLMNCLLERCITPSEAVREEKKVSAKDALFVTLDTTVRKITIPGYHPFLLSDTVGFINELPHALIKAFRSTLEEVKYADILLQVIDLSDPMHDICEKVTEETLREIGAAAIPMIRVYNKTDLAGEKGKVRRIRDKVCLSAANGEGLDLLLEAVTEEIRRSRTACTLLIPYTEGAAYNTLKEAGAILSESYRDDGILAGCMLRSRDLPQYQRYFMEDPPLVQT